MSNKTNRTNKKNSKFQLKPNLRYKQNSKMAESKNILAKNIKEISLIMLLALAGFLLIAFSSYHPFDPGWSRTAQHLTTANLAGCLGAWSADLCLYFLGISAYLLPISLIYIWIAACFKVNSPPNISLWSVKLLGFILTMLATTGITSLLVNQNKLALNLAMPVSLGGIVGDFLSNYLYKQANFWGAGLILLYSLLAGLTAMIGISWLYLLKILYILAIKILVLSAKILLKNYKGLTNIFSIRDIFNKIRFSQKHGAVLKSYKSKTSANVATLDPMDNWLRSWVKNQLIKLHSLRAYFGSTVTAAISQAKFAPRQSSTAVASGIAAHEPTPNLAEDPDKVATTNSGANNIAKQRQAARDFVKQIQTKHPKIQAPAVTNHKHNKYLHQTSNSLPGLDLLEKTNPEDLTYSQKSLPDPANIQAKLADFGIGSKIVEIFPGPVVTRIEMELAPGTKASKVTSLSKDLARSLSVPSVRVVEVIPGKTVVGLEIPNKHRALVRLREILAAEQYNLSSSPLTLALGKDIAGVPVVADLTRMPHLLVAGTTGSGKSVGVNAMLLSILYKASMEDVRLILIDPKMLELSIYAGIPHLLTPVVTDMKDAANALNWCVFEMERRYKLMANLGVRNLLSFNLKVQTAANTRNPMVNPLYNSLLPESINNKQYLEKLPYIVVIIDEFADMMMVVGKKVEEQISRIAQKARAAGIHMILATQRPSVDVITGLIKANIPTRIAFQVSSRIDSRTILDQQGAEQLLGHGDLLYLPPGCGIPLRVHGAFVSDDEVHKVVSYLKNLETPVNVDLVNLNNVELTDPNLTPDQAGDLDPLYDQAVAIVTSSRKASISYLQRRLKIGFNRAARLIEDLQTQQVITTQTNGVREVLAPPPPEQVER